MANDTAAIGSLKRCSGCGVERPRSEFHRHSGCPDGLQRRCKDCAREDQQRLAAKNRARGVQDKGEKLCGMCGATRPLSEFGRDRARKDGRSYYCRDCLAPRKAAAGRRRRTEREASLREEPGAVKTCRSCGETKAVTEFTPNLWVADGREHRCRDCRRPALRAASDAWRAANPDAWSLQNREHVRRRKARLRDAPPVKLARVLAAHGMVCHICGEKITKPRGTSPGALTFDHVVPLACGGEHSERNLRPAHHSCNSRKNARPMSELVA